MARPFRFGVNMLTPAGGTDWRTRCRRAEQLGYDVILVPDHLGLPAPSRHWSPPQRPRSGPASAPSCSMPPSGTRRCWPARPPVRMR